MEILKKNNIITFILYRQKGVKVTPFWRINQKNVNQ